MKKKFVFFSIIMAMLAFFTSGCSDNKKAIEAVLTADANTGSVNYDDIDEAIKSLRRKVQDMKDIDISECPKEFQVAYIKHTAAWEKRRDVYLRLKIFNEKYNTLGRAIIDLPEALLDFSGYMARWDEEKRKIKSLDEEADREITSTWHKCLEIAAEYDVDISKYK